MSPQSLGIDWLHTLSLGVVPHLLGYLAWALFDKNVFGIPGPFSSVFELSVSRIRAELFEWYRQEQSAGRSRTRVQQILPSMFGTSTDRQLKLHAPECNNFLVFSKVLLGKYGRQLRDQWPLWQAAVDSLLDIYRIIKEYDRKIPFEEMNKFIEAVCLHMRTLPKLGVPYKPKHHFLVEMAGRRPDNIAVVQWQKRGDVVCRGSQTSWQQSRPVKRRKK